MAPMPSPFSVRNRPKMRRRTREEFASSWRRDSKMPRGKACESLIVRFGDFFGPKPGNNWFSQGMVSPGGPLKSITYPGGNGVGHDWAYLPDASEAFARLMDREAQLEDFAMFHFRGFWDK